MTEDDQDREIGGMVRERQALVTRAVCARNKADRLGRALEHVAAALTAAAAGEKWAPPGYDGYPSVDDVRSVFDELAETQKTLDALDGRLDQLGIRPRSW